MTMIFIPDLILNNFFNWLLQHPIGKIPKFSCHKYKGLLNNDGNRFTGMIAIANFVSEVKLFKFKMANIIWRQTF